MSISSVKAYARSRMESLGYVEWTDGFNFENIPVTLLDTRYHVELGIATGTENNQDQQTIEVPFSIRFFKSPTRDPKTLIDSAVIAADTVIADLLKASNRLTQTGIKTVYFNSLEVNPLDISNDNGLIIKSDFTALVIIGTR